ncbi:MAG TPA: hypothetical protein VF278_22235 [Pirellulales bacterium]
MDSLEASSRWRRWIVDGTSEQIDFVLASLAAAPPTGWKWQSRAEPTQSTLITKERSERYDLDGTATRQAVSIGIDRVAESKLRGGSIWFEGAPLTQPAPKVAVSWNDIMRFLDEGIIPAARAAAAKVHLPSAEDVFFAELPFDVGNRLKLFTAEARKSLPLNSEEAERWHEFVVSAFRSKLFIDADSFVRWLTANGWQAEAAKELNLRFFDDSLLLSRFADEVLAV